MGPRSKGQRLKGAMSWKEHLVLLKKELRSLRIDDYNWEG